MWHRTPYPSPIVTLIGVVAILTVCLEPIVSSSGGLSQGVPPKVLLFRGHRTPVPASEAVKAALVPPRPVSVDMKRKLLAGADAKLLGSATRTYVQLTPRQPYVENRGFLNFTHPDQVLAHPPFDVVSFYPPTSPPDRPSVRITILPDARGGRYLLDVAVGTPVGVREPHIRTFQVQHGPRVQEFGVEPGGQHLFVILDAEGPYWYSFGIRCITPGMHWDFYSIEATTLS